MACIFKMVDCMSNAFRVYITSFDSGAFIILKQVHKMHKGYTNQDWTTKMYTYIFWSRFVDKILSW